jgi:alkanesulfonate monooxygenase SsuD/methylene tetrahydromethanopterin reductase-like flavin-dependent oxidoreductase (luciferase family)
MIGVTATAAATEQEARFQAGAGALSMLLLRSGRLREVPTPEEAAGYPYSQAEADLITTMQTTELIGTGEEVADGLRGLVDRFDVDELMITTRVHGAAARHSSFELLAKAFQLAPRSI